MILAGVISFILGVVLVLSTDDVREETRLQEIIGFTGGALVLVGVVLIAYGAFLYCSVEAPKGRV